MSRNQDGFTLVEMIVVVAILALMVVMVLLSSRRSSGVQQLDAIAHSIAANLRLARIEAIGQNREAALVIDLKRRTAHLASSRSDIEIPEDIALDIVTARGDIADKSAAFRFFPDGTATGGRIVLKRDGAARRIAIQWLTGRVAVEVEGPP
jgi:general secretion pathway protein H